MNICLIGNGPTALVLAKILLSKNICVHHLIKSRKNRISKLRTIGISNTNVDYLEKFFPKLRNLGNPIKEIKIFNENNINKQILNFNYQNSIKFYVFKYQDLIKYFNKFLAKENNIKTFLSKKFNTYSERFKKKYDIIIDTELNTQNSLKIFFSKINKDYNSTAYTTIINHDKINNNIARQIFTSHGPIAFLPLNENKTSIVISIKRSNKIIDKDKILDVIKKNNLIYKNINFNSFESFNLKFSMLRKYKSDNILAFGDKLHTIHPLAGQGFNMSIRDIKVLSKLIDEKIKYGLPINKIILEEFEDLVKHKNVIFSTGIDFIYEFFLIEKKFPKVISKNLFNFLNRNKTFNKFSELLADKGISI